MRLDLLTIKNALNPFQKGDNLKTVKIGVCIKKNFSQEP